eukprot:g12672.t1
MTQDGGDKNAEGKDDSDEEWGNWSSGGDTKEKEREMAEVAVEAGGASEEVEIADVERRWAKVARARLAR